MGGEHGLDLAEFDPVTTDLDLEVVPAEEFEGAVGPVAAQVARAVEALAGDRVDDELRRGAPGVVPVALGHARAPDVEVAGDVVRLVGEFGVQDMEGLVP